MANGTPATYKSPNYPNVWGQVKSAAKNLWWVIALVVAIVVLWHFFF